MPKQAPVNIDADPVNADWTKATWDLPPYGSQEFKDYLKSVGMTLAHFKTLPVFKQAVANGTITLEGQD